MKKFQSKPIQLVCPHGNKFGVTKTNLDFHLFHDSSTQTRLPKCDHCYYEMRTEDLLQILRKLGLSISAFILN